MHNLKQYSRTRILEKPGFCSRSRRIKGEKRSVLGVHEHRRQGFDAEIGQKAPFCKKSIKLLLIFLVSTLCFCGVTLSVLWNGIITHWNLPIQHWMENIRQPFLDKIMVLITLFDIKVMIFMWLATGLYLLLQKRIWTAICWILINGAGSLFCLILKTLIDYPRPTNILHQHLSGAFPSIHVFCHIVLLGGLNFLINYHKPIQIKRIYNTLLVGWIFLLAFSRSYLSAHWFSDIIGGMLLGLSSLTLFCFSYSLLKRKTYGKLQIKYLGFIALLSIILGWGVNIKQQYYQAMDNYSLDPLRKVVATQTRR